MIYLLKNYQREAVDELKDYIQLSLQLKSKKEIVFKAPTGSGKTFMAASLFEELACENNNQKFCILWVCPGKGELHKQSYDAVKTYLGGNPVCSLLEDNFFGSRKYIKDKEIVFINWEKLIQKDKETGKWANNLMKDQEGMNFIDVIDETKKDGIKIILVVDESHIGASQKTRIKEFINTIINPNIVLEMSATPLNNHIDVEIDSQKVIDEGMIKCDVIVNEGITNNDKNLQEKDSEILILEKGYKKRLEILNEYKNLNININPLVLIQIPNVDEGEAKKKVIKDFLFDRGINEDNGKLKFWCDDKNNFDKKNIKNNNDITEFLVFKTAVATGWDCPRAHILVKFREGKSETFETQTIGRILRTAEAKSYENYLLDNAYIFTNIWSFETKADTYNPNRIKTEFSKMKEEYNKTYVWEQTHLISFYRSRQGDYNSADSRFSKFYINEFMNYFNLTEDDKNNYAIYNQLKLEQRGLNLEIKIKDEILAETNIGIEAANIEKLIYGNQAAVLMSDNDVVMQYNLIIKENLNGLAYVRSKSPITSAIIDAFNLFYNVFPRNERISSIMKIVVNNKDIFSEIISNSTRKFREMISKEAYKKGDNYDFKIEEVRPYSIDTHVELPCLKSLYQPLYVLKNKNNLVDNKLEKDFLHYLDKQEEVEWYWENGAELMRINFGIEYNNGMNTFQPDFIVKFKDGSVGIFDTKPIGYRVDDTTIKANALKNYLTNINVNRGNLPKVRGGIVVKKGTQFYLYMGIEYHDFDSDSNYWINFNDLLDIIKKENYNKNN